MKGLQREGKASAGSGAAGAWLRRCLWLVALAGAVNGAEPQTRVSYSDAYGKGLKQPELGAADLPRFSPVAASDAIRTFRLRKGFRIELAAAEPDVVSPVAMAFDEHGRMFVAEMVDYSERREENPHAGRIRRLEDRDGDGSFETATVYADNIPWPTGVICSQGGIYVCASPDILFLKDADGDGRAEERVIAFTGFGAGNARLNVQALPNSLNWGLDNRIHGATGPNGGRVHAVPGTAGEAIDLRGMDFSFDPGQRRIRAEAGGGQYGLSFDSQGRRYLCSNSDHLQQVVYELTDLGGRPGSMLPAPRMSIASDGPAAEVFRLSPDEPWRIVRTRWRISGVVPGMVEGGGRVSGYFTGATGATVYRGDAFGPGFVDSVFIGDAGGNLVHRKVLHPAGVASVARRAPDELESEFLASTDTWFRPVHFQNGPDGCLYVVDMYREVIEHPWSIPESIKRHLDLNSGNDRGRIWRIVPEGHVRRKRGMPGAHAIAELVEDLRSPNGWHRETAARLLHERQEREAIPLLERALTGWLSPESRIQVLHVLHGLGAPLDRSLKEAACDPDPVVREHAVRLARELTRGGASGPLSPAAWEALAADPACRVRFHVALALAEQPGRARLLRRLLGRDGNDEWVRGAVLHAIGDEVLELWKGLAGAGTASGAGLAEPFTVRLAGLMGSRGRKDEVSAVLDTLRHGGSAGLLPARALLEGLTGSGHAVGPDAEHGWLPELASRVLEDSRAGESVRVAALGVLRLVRYERLPELLAPVLSGGSGALAEETIRTLGHKGDAPSVQALMAALPGLPAPMRLQVVQVLGSRPGLMGHLVEGLKGGRIRREEVPASLVRQLRGATDAGVSAFANGFFPEEEGPEVLLKRYEGALKVVGDSGRGEAIYRERCQSCHRAGEMGVGVGPDLVTVRAAGGDRLLLGILNPNAEVAPQYMAFQLDLRDGESITALIVRETPTHVAVREAGGQTREIARTQILRMTSAGRSLMPEGLGSGLDVEGMADLLSFLQSAPPPVGR